MPTTTWQIAFEEILKGPLGHYAFNTTTNIAANQLVVSTEAANRFPRDNTFIGWYMLIRGVNNDETIRVVEDYAAATGTFTVDGIALAADAGGSVRFDLLRFNPDDVKAHYNRARQDIFPSIGILRDYWFLSREQQHLYTMPAEIREVRRVYTARIPDPKRSDNLLLNSVFDDWTSATAVDNWTAAGGSASANQEKITTSPTNEVVLFQNSVRLLTSSAAATLLQTLSSLDVATQDVPVSFSAWVFGPAGKIQATLAGSNIQSNPVDGELNQHDGWSRVTVDGRTVAAATSFQAGIRIPGTDVASYYIGATFCTVGADLAGHEPDWTHNVNYDEVVMATNSQAVSGDTPVTPAGTKQILIPSPLARATIVRVQGVDTLESVSADSDTISADGGALSAIYAKTREYLARQKADEPTSGDNLKWKRLQSEYHNDFNEALSEGKGSDLPVKAPSAPDIW
jgi:hypothetical protein